MTALQWYEYGTRYCVLSTEWYCSCAVMLMDQHIRGGTAVNGARMATTARSARLSGLVKCSANRWRSDHAIPTRTDADLQLCMSAFLFDCRSFTWPQGTSTRHSIRSVRCSIRVPSNQKVFCPRSAYLCALYDCRNHQCPRHHHLQARHTQWHGVSNGLSLVAPISRGLTCMFQIFASFGSAAILSATSGGG